MKLLETLNNIGILAIFVAGAFFPPAWVLLLILVYLKRDSDISYHNNSVKPTYTSTPSFTEESEVLDLNYLKIFKHAYLKSDQWDVKRKAILKRDSYTCQACNTSGVPLEVHHISYSRLGSELPSDLVSVCRDCHQTIHDTYGYDYNSTFPLVS